VTEERMAESSDLDALPRGRPHIGLFTRAIPGSIGGVAQATQGLIHALGKLTDGDEQYSIIVTSTAQAEWLTPHFGPNQRIVVHQSFGATGSYYAGGRQHVLTRFRQNVLSPLLPAIRWVQKTLSPPRNWPEIPISDGFIEALGCDVIHFSSQWFMLCNVPSVYTPHDLQHLLYPQYFSQSELVSREVIFPAGCRFAHTVIAGTQWVKEDIARRYRIDDEKIQVIPWAASTQFCEPPSAGDLADVAARYRLETPFVIFPANTWPHKNHVRLLEAIAHLRETRGLIVKLVCTGAMLPEYWPRIEARIEELNLGSQVKFLGFVSEKDLRALYRLAHCLVMPTLYEADSNPIHEAWYEDLPVASSNVTALPDQVKDAGVLFDPRDINAMANAIARLMTDDALRDDLRQRGRRRMGDFDWERTAKAYRAVYRRAADYPLTEEDRWLLQWDWLRDPHRKRASAALQTLTS
jgi:glycosyltransferase involved in cell wall biosynthesis